MLLEWCLILSVTLVSTTMLMMLSTYFAILNEAMQFYQQDRTMVLLLSNSFNIFHIVLTPLIFNSFNKHFFRFVLISTLATGVGVIGKYYAGTNYNLALFMTIIVAIAHIPIISAPYGLLKLFPDWQRGYAASVPLFLPVLGINFCIIYGMTYIANDNSSVITTVEKQDRIHHLNAIVGYVGIIATILTTILLFKLRSKIQSDDKSTVVAANNQDRRSFAQKFQTYLHDYWHTIILGICWGSILGTNWTYGSLYGIIFESQGLSEKDIALIGLAANLSTAISSNLGTFVRNRFKLSTTRVIGLLNLCGFIAAILIQASKYIPAIQGLPTLIGLIVILRAGYSSFVTLAFEHMQGSGLSGVIVSGLFFWVANVVNLLGMQVVDLIKIDISMTFLTLTVAICMHFVSETFIQSRLVNDPSIQ